MKSASHFHNVDEGNLENIPSEDEESKTPLQLAIVGRPNVGKSTLLNTLLQEDRVLVGPEAGLTRDSVRAQFEYQGRTIYMVKISLSCVVFKESIIVINVLLYLSGRLWMVLIY